MSSTILTSSYVLVAISGSAPLIRYLLDQPDHEAAVLQLVSTPVSQVVIEFKCLRPYLWPTGQEQTLFEDLSSEDARRLREILPTLQEWLLAADQAGRILWTREIPYTWDHNKVRANKLRALAGTIPSSLMPKGAIRKATDGDTLAQNLRRLNRPNCLIISR